MAIRRETNRFGGARLPLLLVGAGAILAGVCAGCAAPGEPIERHAAIPAAVSDLAATQQGNDVELTFTLPDETADHRPLKKTPEVEIYRDFQSTGAAPATGAVATKAPASPTLLATIPPATVDLLNQKRHFKYPDVLAAQDFSGGGKKTAVYVVRTRASEKRASADSNAVSIAITPAYAPIQDAKAENARDGVAISWTAPAETIAATKPAITGYRIYRAPAAGTGADESAKPKSTLQRVADVAAPPYVDLQFEFGARYVYSVRTVSSIDGLTVESADSNLAEVTPRDVFPPAAPEGLVVTLIPAVAPTPTVAGTPAFLELSWAISAENDVTGYNVYRSDDAGAAGKRVNAELLPTPSFRDMTTDVGRQYFYTVTAVDRAGNESAASAAVSGTTP